MIEISIKIQKNLLKPFDTIKTKMQAQVGFEKEGMVNTIIKTIKNDGIKGLYRWEWGKPKFSNSKK